MYKLIIVDDENSIRNGMANSIPWTDWGFEVVGTACDGIEALDLVEALCPDIILSDMRMPRMDGMELMREVSERYPTIKIIILSGYSDIEYLKSSIKHNVIQYLLKPTDMIEFEEAFKNAKERLDKDHERDIKIDIKQIPHDAEFNYQLILNSIISKNGEGAKNEINRVGNLLAGMESNIAFIDNVFMELLFYLARKITAYDVDFSEVMGICEFDYDSFHKMSIVERTSCLYALIDALTDSMIANSGHDERTHRLARQIKECVDDEYMQNYMSLDYLADKVNKSRAYISKLFKNEFGIGFSEYITNKRLEASKQLLADPNIKIYDIAARAGYADVSNFIKVFKKKYGISPGEYRNML